VKRLRLERSYREAVSHRRAGASENDDAIPAAAAALESGLRQLDWRATRSARSQPRSPVVPRPHGARAVGAARGVEHVTAPGLDAAARPV